MNPSISIITRTYNSAAYVEDALKSIFQQTLDPQWYEIILVDDGSTDDDDIEDIVKRYGKKIRPVFQNHLGFVRAINAGIEHSRAPYVTLLDADDTFSTTILEKMYHTAIANPDSAYIYCDYYEHIVETGQTKTVSTGKNLFDCLAEGILFKKSALEKLGGYDESLFFPEYDILIALSRKGEGVHIPEPLFTYNRHAGSLTSKQKRVAMGKRQLTKKYGDIPEIAKIRDY